MLTITDVTPYALPAIVALLAKAGIYFYARFSKVHNIRTQIYLLFLFALSIQNVAEIVSFMARAQNLPTPPSGILYFGASIPAIALLLHLTLVTARSWNGTSENLPVKGLMALYAPALVLEALLWSGPLLVAGFEPMAYTYTKVAGPLYPLFQLYAIGYLVVAAGMLIYGACSQATPFRRLQNKLLLLGLTPWVALVIAIIILQQFGFRGFNSTTTLPLATTFFLVITAYATHQIRLFDIEFFIPWSTVRRRKTAFYERIQALIAEIADMGSVNKIVNGLSDALRCPVVLIGGPRPALAMAGEALGVARFPLDELKRINHIIVANEIVDAMPSTYALMKRHKVAAIVPFHPHSEAAASWMLLGDSFSEQVYSPLDFKVVETLFARLADHFLDKQLLLRSQLSEAQREMQLLQERLAAAWDQIEQSRKNQKALEDENTRLRRKNTQILRHELSEIELQLMDEAVSGKRTLEEYGAEFEARMIEKVLAYCEGDRERAAEMLGLTSYTLHHKMVRYRLDRKT